jgi:succinyl-CoA synthetase alpha subunit
MVAGFVIRKNEYHDSVFLMRVAKTLSEKPGVLQAAALMGTEKNKGLLLEIGFHGPEIAAAAPQDLILAVQAERQDVLDAIIGSIDQWLHPTNEGETRGSVRTLEEAWHRQPRSNLTVISLPGEYAGREAKKALELGMHVFLFSDHVSLEEEISLKEFAREKGLLVMGPDCGTAIIDGTGIGFANRVRKGPIGVIGASGTGIQEFTSLVHRSGSGISQAIGTGSRDFSDAVGGLSFLSAIEALEKDIQTRAITILSKPPGKSTLARLAPRILKCSKPVIVCFLGFKENIFRGAASCRLASTLDEAAILAVQAGGEVPPSLSGANQAFLDGLIQKELAGKNPTQKYLRGLFAGGTFCYQAQQILMDYGIEVYSNAPLEGNLPLPNSANSIKHTLVDLGADEFTSGRPHPMIDSRLRCDRLQKEAKDPEVGILLLDIILGFNSCPDPAGDLAPAIIAAKREVSGRGGALSVVASICGTEDDIQDLNRQTRILEDAGVLVFPSSAQAVRFSALLAKTFTEKRNGK